jgi:hypothetical protein
MLTRSKTWALLLLAATFLAGTTVGSGLRALWARRAEAAATRTRGPDRMLAALTTELELTPAQHDSVGAVLQRHWVRLNAVWERVRPRFDSIRADMDSEVVRQLSAEQAAKYRDHVTRYRRRQEQERQPAGDKR